MAFEPDIIVTGPESSEIALVADAKISLKDLETTERQLKKYIVGMSCPVGLIVTPQKLIMYVNRYRSLSEDSIERVGEFDVHDVLHFDVAGPRAAFEFEHFVQTWLERLGTAAGLRELSPELRRAAEWYIAPAISQGMVRAGHPRPAISA